MKADNQQMKPSELWASFAIEAARAGGYVVRGVGPYMGQMSRGDIDLIVFAGDLESCLAFIERSIVKVD